MRNIEKETEDRTEQVTEKEHREVYLERWRKNGGGKEITEKEMVDRTEVTDDDTKRLRRRQRRRQRSPWKTLKHSA